MGAVWLKTAPVFYKRSSVCQGFFVEIYSKFLAKKTALHYNLQKG